MSSGANSHQKTRRKAQKIKQNENKMKTTILGVKAPSKECKDAKCPFHGQLTVKPETFQGKVIRKDTNRSATIEWTRTYYVQKFERYEPRRSRMHVHNPPCIDAALGETVLVAKTRPLSKTKNHVILQVVIAAKALPFNPEDDIKNASSSKKKIKHHETPEKIENESSN